MSEGPAQHLDPRNLIREAYWIEGIGVEDCRSIFFDWALGLREHDPTDAAGVLLEHYVGDFPDHPMTGLLREAVAGGGERRSRRGGPARRRRP